MCTSPMKAFKVPGKLTANGKQQYVIRPLSAPFADIGSDLLREFIFIPCGKCKECKLQSAKEWSIRCSAEAAMYPETFNYFITLTYDDAHLPVTTWTDPVTGEFIDRLGTLRRSDVDFFIDSLRSFFSYHFSHCGIRYFGSAEYGSRGRPHYHIILFNCPLQLLGDWSPDHPYDLSDLGNALFRSSKLEKIWNKGLVLFSLNSSKCAAYTARYTLKKADLPSDGFLSQLRFRSKSDLKIRDYYHRILNTCCINPFTYHPFDQEYEFTFMSTHPGIGRPYFEKYYKDILVTDELWVTGKRTSLPRYFASVLEKLDPDMYADFKKRSDERNRLRIEALLSNKLDFDFEMDMFNLRRSVVDNISKIYKRSDL